MKNSFFQLRATAVGALALLACLNLSSCVKSPEKMGDAFLASAEKSQNPKAKEEREKKAYYKYLEAVNGYLSKGQPVPEGLREKILTQTLAKLNRELSRFIENPEEANTEQINLWRQDFQKFLPGLKNAALIKEYSQFLLSFANPEFMDLQDVMDVLNEVVALQVKAPEGRQKIKEIQSKYAGELISEAERIYTQVKASLKGRIGNKDNLVMAEYKLLLALKSDPGSEKARTLLRLVRDLMLDTYSGYERFQDALGGTLDPEIDKYDIYMCIPKRSIGKASVALTVSIWNLTATPIEVKYDYLFLVSDNLDTVKADKSTKFHKITLDTKTDSTQTVVFNIPKGKPFPIRNLLYNDGTKISEKFFH
jgi:hypothetical protein